jgi:autotransporter-associated beta strand protein
MDRSFTIGAGGATLVANGSETWQITQLNSGGREAFTLASDGGTLTLSGPANGEFGKVIPGSGGVTKTGAGTWTLSGANTYTGTTTVTQGILSLTSPSLALTSSVVIGSGGTLNLNFAGNDVVSALEINGSGPLAAGAYNSSHPTYGSYFTGSGTLLVVNGSNGIWTSLADGNWEETTNWASNTIATGFNQTATFNATTGATVTLTGGVTIGNLVFDVSDYTLTGAALTLDSSSTPAISVASGRTATISANLSGTGGMQKNGAGTLVLTAANTYTGDTTINAGTLNLQTGGETGTIRGTLAINSGATVILSAVDALGYGGNAVSQVTILGGTLDNAANNNNSYVTDYTLTAGTISSSGGGAFNFNNGYGITTLASGSPSLFSAPIYMRNSNSLPINVANGAAAVDFEISGAIGQLLTVGGVTKSGMGTAVFSGANTYTGNTYVDEGTLAFTSTSQMQFVVTEAPASNQITGSGTATFDGVFIINTTAVTGTTGYIWLLVDRASLSGESFGTNFSVAGFTQQGDGVTWTMNDSRGTWSFSEDSGELSLVVEDDYDTWKSANGVTGGPNDDDDADGLTNFEEYAFGLDPTGGSSVNPITGQLNKTNGTFSYTRRTQSLTGLTYKVWTSTDLATWSEDAGATASQTVTGTAGEVQTVQATITGTLPLTAPKLFIQVRAE